MYRVALIIFYESFEIISFHSFVECDLDPFSIQTKKIRYYCDKHKKIRVRLTKIVNYTFATVIIVPILFPLEHD